MMTLRSSRRISWYPCLSFSMSAASSATTCWTFSIRRLPLSSDSLLLGRSASPRENCGFRIADFGLSYQAFRYLPIRNPQSPIRNPLVSQRVYNIVHAVFIGLVGFFDGHERIVGPLPVLADIVVVIDHHHEALLVVAHAQVLGNEAASVRRWRQQVRDIIETLEYLVRAGQLLKGMLRKHHLQLRFEVFDLALPPEVVHDQKTSAQEILAHVVRLFLGQVQKPYLAEIRNRILEDLVVVKGNNMSFAVDVELGDLRQDLHEVLVSRWIIVTPRRTLPAKSPPVQARSRVPDTRQRKLVFHQRRFILRHDSQRDEGGSYRASTYAPEQHDH